MSTYLRLPPDLHDRIKALAERETRSLHGQVLQLVREALVAREHPRDGALDSARPG